MPASPSNVPASQPKPNLHAEVRANLGNGARYFDADGRQLFKASDILAAMADKKRLTIDESQMTRRTTPEAELAKLSQKPERGHDMAASNLPSNRRDALRLLAAEPDKAPRDVLLAHEFSERAAGGMLRSLQNYGVLSKGGKLTAKGAAEAAKKPRKRKGEAAVNGNGSRALVATAMTATKIDAHLDELVRLETVRPILEKHLEHMQARIAQLRAIIRQ